MDITKAFTNSHRIIIWNRIQKYNWIRTRTESRSDTRPTETQVRSTTNRNIGKKHGQHIWKVRNMCGETLCYLSKTRPTEIQVENTDNIIIIYTLLRQTNLRAAFTHGTPSPKQPFSFLGRLAINSYLALCQQKSDSVTCGSAWLTVHSGGWGYRVICVFPSSLQLQK